MLPHQKLPALAGLVTSEYLHIFIGRRIWSILNYISTLMNLTTRPFNTIGMPYYRDTLLSAWPTHLLFEVGAPGPKIDPAIMAGATRTEFGHYAPYPRKTRRYQVEDTRALEKALAAIGGPKFLSEQAKDSNGDLGPGRRMSDVLDALNASHLDGSLKVDVPVMYHNVEIKYSKFGVDDFDFE